MVSFARLASACSSICLLVGSFVSNTVLFVRMATQATHQFLSCAHDTSCGKIFNPAASTIFFCRNHCFCISGLCDLSVQVRREAEAEFSSHLMLF